ncbi:MAG: 3-methylmercaptopropionyl-CoA dehydrogenase (DmdC) [uncultured Pseudonocardia sp.]|uniref:3-methylmercaptopropionyl-CoA dehydrogenase (DmdC) n=1 Tax=uncultured Pseudonocardia sp. TaxID=211455 RepID=A0A6J4P1W2_9PSEU|nr:MAG: 3-methylmercaptopropionyl-CoA dehydrogenase (DmdC) [uncultured Pseudonocardia sp.]
MLLSRRDLEFLLYEWLDVELLTKRERYAEHSRETFDAVLDLAEQVATEHLHAARVPAVAAVTGTR